MNLFSENREVNGEFVSLRGLTYGEFFYLRNNSIRTERLLCYEVCKIGIVDLQIVLEDGTVEKYNTSEHFDLLFSDNYDFMRNCFTIIMEELSTLSEKEVDWIKSFVAFQIFLSDKEELVVDSWSCNKCIEKKLIAKRKCGRFSSEVVDKIMNHNYKPVEIFGFSFEEVKQEKESIEDDAMDVLAKQLAERNSKYKKSKPKLRSQADAIGESTQGVAQLRSPYYTWPECPAYRGGVKFISFLHLLISSSSQEVFPISGGQFEQPNKFIEGFSLLKSEMNRLRNLEEKRMMKEAEKKQQKGNHAGSRRKT